MIDFADADDAALIENYRLILEEELSAIARRLAGEDLGPNYELCADIWWQMRRDRIAALQPCTHQGLVWRMHAVRADAERSGASALVIAALRDYCDLHPIGSVVKPPGTKLSAAMAGMLGDGLREYYRTVEHSRELARLVERQRSRGDV